MQSLSKTGILGCAEALATHPHTLMPWHRARTYAAFKELMVMKWIDNCDAQSYWPLLLVHCAQSECEFIRLKRGERKFSSTELDRSM